ncbi:ComEC/Rec2 family competence protein [Capnocytophaga sp.]|uniref:ComEC/Rec2 family competence protein n=1 Tax=Capnocytophaga sp. TaxID=44737 RepID=UPI0026DACC32|nr:ComEC/Rec2 family competence protein [Capnocytophaga sp.]MDO5104791.1 ComEC/Rec2 family competence protein [Capnocytophaga sp.]
MKFVNTPILILLSGIVTGIAISGVFSVPLWGVSLLFFVLLFSISVHLFLSVKKSKFRKFFAFHTFIVAIVLGAWVSVLRNPTSKSNHYTNQLKENTGYLLQARVIEKVSEADFGTTYKVRLISADNQRVTGDILCFFPTDTLRKSHLQTDDYFAFTSQLRTISPPKNPYQFDYKVYMERQGVFWRTNVGSYHILKSDSKTASLQKYAEIIREKAFEIIDANFSKSTSSILKTLLLGQRNQLDDTIYQQYIDAGAVHILAISGLHVGIITVILLFFLQRLPNTKFFKIFRFVALLLILWTFAFLAGLSPSVLRAVTMFSFIGISLQINRRQGRFDALMLSMLLLLLVYPNFLYALGFQLSYAAVFSILTFYPRMEKWWKPKNSLLRYVWSLTIIGFSAQIGVLPISLYYFHQFPLLFFASNLLIVPLLSPVLVLGFLMIFLGFFDILPSFLVFLLEKIINLMNFLAKMIASQEYFIVRNVYFNEKLLICSFVVILLLIFWLNKQNFRRIMLFLLSVLLFQSVLFYEKYKLETSKTMTVFQIHQKSLFLIRNAKQLIVFQNDTTQNNIVTNYAKTIGTSDISIRKIPHLFDYQNKNILCLDSLGVFPISENIPIDKIIITQSPKINFERMLLKIKPKKVIADGSNASYLIKKWQAKSEELGIPFHATAEKGAYIIAEETLP